MTCLDAQCLRNFKVNKPLWDEFKSIDFEDQNINKVMIEDFKQ